MAVVVSRQQEYKRHKIYVDQRKTCNIFYEIFSKYLKWLKIVFHFRVIREHHAVYIKKQHVFDIKHNFLFSLMSKGLKCEISFSI